ncbi:uncharacterized protein [Palaemon carinicauda]|uniref:uncharacterized protein n=1 Tax=Palaemon carinicauda TaxID=392227 RepID=UPI0035B59CE6
MNARKVKKNKIAKNKDNQKSWHDRPRPESDEIQENEAKKARHEGDDENCGPKPPLVNNISTSEKPKFNSALLKKWVEQNDIGGHLLRSGNFGISQECSPVGQDYSVNKNAVSYPENNFIKTSPVKIIRGTSKYPYYESVQEPLASSPGTPDLQSSSFGRSSAYKVVKFLNLSADSNDRFDMKNDRTVGHSAFGQNCNASTGSNRFDPSLGTSNLGTRDCSDYTLVDDHKPQSFHNFLRNFWDTKITSPGLPSPIARTTSSAEERTNHITSAMPLESNLYSRPFPTTPPPTHEDNEELKFRPVAGAMFPAQVHHSNNSSYLDNQDNQYLLSPEYFLLQPESSSSAHNITTPGCAESSHKTDIVTLMQELALTYKGRFCEEASSLNNMQDDPMLKRPLDYCVFCKKNSEHATFYRSHTLRDKRGLCQCPVLRVYVCPLCKGTGDNAHTLKYCPYNYVTRGDPITAGLPPGKVTNWRNMAKELLSRK